MVLPNYPTDVSDEAFSRSLIPSTSDHGHIRNVQSPPVTSKDLPAEQLSTMAITNLDNTRNGCMGSNLKLTLPVPNGDMSCFENDTLNSKTNMDLETFRDKDALSFPPTSDTCMILCSDHMTRSQNKFSLSGSAGKKKVAGFKRPSPSGLLKSKKAKRFRGRIPYAEDEKSSKVVGSGDQPHHEQ